MLESRCSLEPQWIVGFVDGEGCFSVSIHRNPYVRKTRGWQIHPVFQVYQHERHRAVLEELTAFFGCGSIRPKGPTSSVLTYAVDGLRDLEEKVVPFFELHPLRVKQSDFDVFAVIVRVMRRRHHEGDASEGALDERRVRATGTPCLRHECRGQAAQPVARSGVSGILRDCTPGTPERGVKIQSDPRGDMRSQAEMT